MLIRSAREFRSRTPTLFVTDRATGEARAGATVGEPIDLIGHVKFELGRGFSPGWPSNGAGAPERPSPRGWNGRAVGALLPVASDRLQGESMGVINLSHSRSEAFDEESQKLR